MSRTNPGVAYKRGRPRIWDETTPLRTMYFQVPESLYQTVFDVAKARGVSRSQVMREAINNLQNPLDKEAKA